MSETIAAPPTEELLASIGEQALFSEDPAKPSDFELHPDSKICDIVMKGGVTSGVVYPYAVLRLAKDFRLAGIGGTSAGAMAASLAAAAEYARLAHNDPASFSRFERQCLNLPDLLPNLFQPYEELEATFSFATALMQASDKTLEQPDQPDTGAEQAKAKAANQRSRRSALFGIFKTRSWRLAFTLVAASVLGGVLGAVGDMAEGFTTDDLRLWGILRLVGIASVVGLTSAGLLLWSLYRALQRTSRRPIWVYLGWAMVAVAISVVGGVFKTAAVVLPAFLSGGLGLVAGIFVWSLRVVKNLQLNDFGFCSGLRREGVEAPGVTDWLHAAIQDVAGRRAHGPPLTFGDVERAGSAADGPRLALRMITTNLSLRRPYALPEIGGHEGVLAWKPSEWRKLFPKDVVNHLTRSTPKIHKDLHQFPEGCDLPVIVGARMSLSFPLLFSAVPIYERPNDARAHEDGERMLLIDGGLSSNLPLHFFDSLGPPTHPTFAFNLQDVEDPAEAKEPVSLHKPDQPSPFLSPTPVDHFLDFVYGLLGAAKDWQDNLQSIMPGQFDRIVNIRLTKGQGGLNLVMPKHRSRKLMQLGYLAGDELARHFDLGAHRIRRALTAYQEIERVAEVFGAGWTKAELARALELATVPSDASTKWPQNKDEVIKRFGQLADWSKTLNPPMRHNYIIAPRGSLRITPNLSGDV